MRWLIGGCLTVALAGCAGTGLRTLEPVDATVRRAVVDDVPFVAQAEGHCGPAALAMVLDWSGDGVPPEELAPDLITPARGGTLEHDLLGAARAHGRLAVPLRGLEPVLAELTAGHPVIVLQNLALSWWPQWHYAVAIGFDLDRDEVVLHSGTDAARRMGLDRFRQTFERAGERAIVVLPPERLPASGDEALLLAAAVGLEHAGQLEAALATYGAMIERWPGSHLARLGRGNVLLASGDLAGAEQAFRQLVAERPATAVAWNNLAHLLMLKGALGPAEQAAARALDLGGPAAVAARSTLREIEEVRRARG